MSFRDLAQLLHPNPNAHPVDSHALLIEMKTALSSAPCDTYRLLTLARSALTEVKLLINQPGTDAEVAVHYGQARLLGGEAARCLYEVSAAQTRSTLSTVRQIDPVQNSKTLV